MPEYDIIVVGGGMIGASIAYGLTRLGRRVALVDQDDGGIRAAAANFGLIWVQGKGDGCPVYAAWTRRSADLWGGFNQELEELTGIKTGYARPGAMHFCLSDAELAERDQLLARVRLQSEGAFDYKILPRAQLAPHFPGLGSEVVGASFSLQDGCVNPLYLLYALHAGIRARGGTHLYGTVDRLTHGDGAFQLHTATNSFAAGKVVLAAGLGNRGLADSIGLASPLRPQRGQILVTERLRPFLNYPTLLIRQMPEGTVMLGDSHEEVGFNNGVEPRVLRTIADRARRMFPCLEATQIIRAWGGLRILTPDSLPIYDQGPGFPGSFAASAHSGVTLAAIHALTFAGFVDKGELPGEIEALSERRFHVP